MRITDRTNLRRPKHILPAIVYIPLIVTGYPAFDIFNTEVAEVQDKNLQTTEFLNPNLPGVQIRNDDGTGGKYGNMAKSYGRITDYSTVDSIECDNEEGKEAYESKYIEEDLAELVYQAKEKDDAVEIADAETREAEALEAFNKTLVEVRLRGRAAVVPVAQDTVQAGPPKEQIEVKGQIAEDNKAVKALDEEDKIQGAVKKTKMTSDCFNTLAQNEYEPRLTKAIIDESTKAMSGLRVQLRLLDDIEIGGIMVKRGPHLYATMSSSGLQRARGNINSILVDDGLIEVPLSPYDTDGLEGLYVPGSQFRETTKSVAGGTMQNDMNIDQNGVNNSFSQWGTQAATNAYQKTGNAISKVIKKNKVKPKYGTLVYLINGKEKGRWTLSNSGIVGSGGSQSINIRKSTNTNCFQKMNVYALLSLSILSARAQTIYMGMGQLTVNDRVTTVITVSEPIRFVSISTDKMVGNQPINNTIRLKPKDSVCTDGEVLVIVIIVTECYRTQYALFCTTRMRGAVTGKEIECSECDAYNSPTVGLSAADMAKYARQIWSLSAKYRNVVTEIHRMVICPNNIYSVGEYFLIDFSVENKTNIHFDIDEMRIKLLGKGQNKATNAQVVELIPSLMLGDARTSEYGYRDVTMVEKMTFPNDKVLTIELSEKQTSGRTISLSIDYEDVLSADSFNHILLGEE